MKYTHIMLMTCGQQVFYLRSQQRHPASSVSQVQSFRHHRWLHQLVSQPQSTLSICPCLYPCLYPAHVWCKQFSKPESTHRVQTPTKIDQACWCQLLLLGFLIVDFPTANTCIVMVGYPQRLIPLHTCTAPILYWDFPYWLFPLQYMARNGGISQQWLLPLRTHRASILFLDFPYWLSPLQYMIRNGVISHTG